MDSELPPVLPSASPPNTPVPRKSRTWLVVVLGLAGAALLGVLVMVGTGSLFVLTAKEQPLSVKDRAALLTVEDVAPWVEGFSPDKSMESFSKKRYLDGSYEIDYEFDDPVNEEAPYVMCSIAVEPKVSDALISHKAMQAGINIGFAAEGKVELVERNDLFQWGDASKFSLILSGGAPVGMVFSARKKRHVFLLSISGVYSDDSVAIEELLVKPLLALERLPAP
ncbi:MAG: hypothetical protein QF406_05005 [Verrucomicrobiota bacterium]|nr:hypothetical protein [Verrucomicrobiota bacterium]